MKKDCACRGLLRNKDKLHIEKQGRRDLMNFFDLHCDTIVFAHRKMEGLRKNSMHISLEKGRCLNKWC